MLSLAANEGINNDDEDISIIKHSSYYTVHSGPRKYQIGTGQYKYYEFKLPKHQCKV